MLSIAVCDDEVLDCCKIAKGVKNILEEMEITYTIQQFYNGKDLLQAVENFDIIFLDIMMYDLWEGSEWDKLGDYLETMIEDGNIGSNDDVTGSKAIDVLLYQKKKLAM